MSNLMPDEVAQKIVSNPNGYTNESVFLAEAYLCVMEMNIQDHEKENEPNEEHKHLFRFYNVSSYEELATVQDEHIGRLQKKIPKIRNTEVNTSNLRQG